MARAHTSAGRSLPPLVAAMSDPEFYAHRPERVEVRQTHISWVFLAGDTVYKLKKPVRFTFLDYSTRERRHFFCGEEVRLNRRLAPSVYLGVVAVLRADRGFVLAEDGAGEGSAETEDHVVKMRRLLDERMLDHLLREGRVGGEVLSTIVEKLAVFHRACSSARAEEYGNPGAIGEMISTNLCECAPFVGDLVGERSFRAIDEFMKGFVAEHERLLSERVRSQRIREGHGDLRAEHVCLSDGIEIVDCIEFSEQLRTCDVASEIAFLAMDLDALGLPVLADELAERYAGLTDDPDMATLMPFYKSHRALVRGKVEGLKTGEREVAPAESEAARDSAARHFRLAARYCRGPRRPALLIVCGLSGTGKSTVARAIGDFTGFPVLNSDVVRKDLAGIPRTARPNPEESERIYRPAFIRKTYIALLEQAKAHLTSGRGVVIDATFQEQEHRRWFIELAAAVNVAPLFLECQSGEKEVARRLEERRSQRNEASDATWPVYLSQRRSFAPFREGAPHRILDTDRRSETVILELERLFA